MINNNVNSDKNKENNTLLQLGDIIHITDPKNELLNNKTFLIDYINNNFIRLVSKNDIYEYQINEGIIGNNTITNIDILSRAESNSYAIQNGLLPGKWVNIYLSTDIPEIIVGLITNLEKDIIEVKTTDNETIYIDFNYSGIPLDIPIETIELRDKPTSLENKEKESLEGLENLEETTEPTFENEENEEDEENEYYETENLEEFEEPIISKKPIKEYLNDIIFDADQIHFGENLQPIIQQLEVSKEKYRYNINEQCNDLLDSLLSTIPYNKRIPSVLNIIHSEIERFKQLRELFSEFDKYNNIIDKKKIYEEYQEESGEIIKVQINPLKNNLLKFDKSLYWLLLVANNKKKVYDVDNKDDENEDNKILSLNTIQDLDEIINLINEYKSNTLKETQNKYIDFIQEINPYFTPFDELNPENTQNIIYENVVQDNFNCLMNTNGDFFSYNITKNLNLNTTQFLFQKYNTGIKQFTPSLITSSKLEGKLTFITESDLLEITSIMTLPEPTVRFSKINLPETSLLEKANLNLNFLNYWQIFKDKTNKTINNVFVDEFNETIVFNPNTYLKKITNYSYSINDENKINKTETYSQFLNSILPKIKTHFHLIKKYIRDKLSLVYVLEYLEPFLIYSTNLNYEDYKEINAFILEKIKDYISLFIKRKHEFSKLRNTLRKNVPMHNIIYDLIHFNLDLKSKIFLEYNYDKTQNLSGSELLKKIISIDYGNLYNTLTSFENISLMFSKNLDALFNLDKTNLKNKDKNLEKENKCKKYVIAKKYKSIEEIKNDDNKTTIYFDKQYDNTDYTILKKYENEQFLLEPDEFLIFLTDLLIKKYKITEDEANALAETLILGYKKVNEGDYALYYADGTLYYFVRENNKWVRYENINNEMVQETPELLCNVQNECISSNEKCNSLNLDKNKLTNITLKEIIEQFDKNYTISKETLENQIKLQLEYFFHIFPKLIEIQNFKILKYNNEKLNIGLIETSNLQKEFSPYVVLRDLILGQTDFVKKQNDIIIFCNHFTREPIPNKLDILDGNIENPYWRYCVKTSTKLIPTFLYELAVTFIEDNSNYENAMDIIIKRIGASSDDGDCWVDKHSGYKIKDIDFDTEEDYDKSGFKNITREILEINADENIIRSLSKNEKPKFNTPENKMIMNIISKITEHFGININGQTEFIIKNVSNTLDEIVPSEETHKRMEEELSKKGKRVESYKTIYNKHLLFLTLGLILIAIQTNVPPIKTKKTFPGCNFSFNGFPIEGDGDYSGLNYLACVSFNTRSSAEPWNVLQKTNQEKTTQGIKLFIEKYLINNIDVKRKIDEKIDYMLLNPSQIIPVEHNIKKWINFLPPLVLFKIKGLENITNQFKEKVKIELKRGSIKQFEKINVIQSKIFYYSLSIQEIIQKIINKKQLLLLTASNQPFIENSCCNDNTDINIISYFDKEDSNIDIHMNIVNNLSFIINDIRNLNVAPLFYCIGDSKVLYPPVNQEFSEETIYKAFIIYCKFNSLVPNNNELTNICQTKPQNFNKNDTIKEQIIYLKKNGYEYNVDTFLNLLKIVFRQNIVKMHNNSEKYIVLTEKLSIFIEKMDNENNLIISETLRNLLKDIIPENEIFSVEDTPNLRKLNNFLLKENENMNKNILDFLIQKIKPSKNEKNKIIDFLNNISNWNYNSDNHNNYLKISDNDQFNSLNFIKNYVQNFILTFPNIVLNNVEYNNITIQKYLNLSSKHENDIKNSIKTYYKSLQIFYNNKMLKNVLRRIEEFKVIVHFINVIPSMSEMKVDEELLHSSFYKRTSKLLSEYLFLLSINSYILLIDKIDIVNDETETENEMFQNDLITTEFLDDMTEKTDIPLLQKAQIIEGKKQELKITIANLLVSYLTIAREHKNLINYSYTDIMNKIFKEKNFEKNAMTDKLKNLSDEERNVNTALKINKLGDWSKGLEKGLVFYDKNRYDDEKIEFENIMNIENNLRNNRKNLDENNIDLLVEEELYEKQIENDENLEERNIQVFDDEYWNNYIGEELEEEDYNEEQ
jgi:hypothetical protein